MNCSNCGSVNNNSSCCVNCGAQLNNNNNNNIVNNQGIGSITIIRPDNFLGCLISYDVYVDNCYVCSVKNNETKQIPIYYGSHFIEIKHGFNKGSAQILVDNNQRNLVFRCPLKLGLITNTIEISLINFYN